MLVVRKEGKAHQRYNSFRSAFELLESVGREPHDCFEESNKDLPPLQKLEQSQLRMEQRIDRLELLGRSPNDCLDERNADMPQPQPLQKMEQRLEKLMKQQIEQSQQQTQARMLQIEQLQMSQQQTQARMQKQIDDLMTENEVLRSKINDVL